jgi:ABC-type uncharacterized transport system substrate-binding protein
LWPRSFFAAKIAKTLGIDMPQSLLGRANEIIE